MLATITPRSLDSGSAPTGSQAAAGAEFLGCSNRPEPLNSGLFCVRPRQQSYLELLDLVANGSFSYYGGWTLRPQPRWMPATSAATARTVNWRFPSAAVEQGLLYYYYSFVRPQGAFVTPHGCTVFAMRRRRLSFHFLGEAKPWMHGPYSSKASLDDYANLHANGLCEWWRTLGIYSRKSKAFRQQCRALPTTSDGPGQVRGPASGVDSLR